MKRWRGLLLAVSLALASAAGATTGGPLQAAWPPELGETLEAYLDDPQAALTPARQRLASARTPAERFWRAQAVARLEYALELDDAHRGSLLVASEALGALPAGDREAAAWMRLAELRQHAVTRGDLDTVQRVAALRAEHETGPATVLRCEILALDAWLLVAVGSLDEAWLTTEALDTCGRDTGWTHFQADAASKQGDILGTLGAPDAHEKLVEAFERAGRLVAPGPARFQRSLFAYAAGSAMDKKNRGLEALGQFQRALSLSRTIGDRAGIAAAQVEIASLLNAQRRHVEALAALDEAERLLRLMSGAESMRLLQVAASRIDALAALRRPEVLEVIAAAERLRPAGAQPALHEELARAAAGGYASQGRYAQAYEAMRRARQHELEGRERGRDAQVLRLQARYDSARREAEIAALRHREEAAQLSLQAEQATQRNLWLALVLLVGLVVAAGAVGWRLLQRRRELADLALKDELTGLPNRRAMEAYGRAQFEQSQRLGLPFSVAMIDLDHFKSVNDRLGHDGGDAVLRVFAQALPRQLRAPDRLGRWGGEEFLLVLPGTRAEEVAMAFERLRTAFRAAPVPGLPSPHGLSFSLGGATAEPGTLGFDALVRAADARLYEAKSAGRDTAR